MTANSNAELLLYKSRLASALCNNTRFSKNVENVYRLGYDIIIYINFLIVLHFKKQ